MRTRFTSHLIARILFPHLKFQPFFQASQAETQTASDWADWGKRGTGGLHVLDSGGIWIRKCAEADACDPLVLVITHRVYDFPFCLLEFGFWLRARLSLVVISFRRLSFLVGLEPPALTCLSGPLCFNLLTFVDYSSGSSPSSYLLF